MRILLLILSIIGITLAVILGILLLLVLMILFVPIRYEADIMYKEAVFDADAKISYLGYLFRVLAGFHQKPYARIKVLWITVKDLLNKEKTSSEKSKKKKNQTEEDLETFEKIETTKTEAISDKQETVNTNIVSEICETDKENEENDTDSEEEKKKSSIKEKLSDVMDKIKQIPGIITSVSEKVSDFFTQTEKRQEKITELIDFVESKEVQAAIKTGKKELIHILKSFAPRKWHVKLEFGFDDPATTGQICGYIGMIYPFIAGHIDAEPNFEKNILNTELTFKGHIRICHVVRAGLVFLFHKNLAPIRRLVFKKELKANPDQKKRRRRNRRRKNSKSRKNAKNIKQKKIS